MECLFCKIVHGELATKIIYEDDKIIGFDDIYPQAPIHKLIIPKKHIATLNDLEAEDAMLIGHMTQAAKILAEQHAIAEEGYRLVINCNAGAGQSVFHIHLHLLGGRQLSWPPG